MAIMNKIVLAASALAAVTLAAPLDARAIVTNIVTETAWTTMDVIATVWVDEHGKILTTEGAVFAQVTPSSSAVVASSSVTYAVETPSVETPSVKSSTTAVPTTTTTTTPAPAVIAVQTTSTTPSPSPVTTTASSASPPAAPAHVSAAPIDSSARDVSASATNDCEGEGTACVGDVTHWDGGLGACGWDVDTSSQLAIALPYGFMGTQSNGNPYCGRSVTLVNPTTGTTVQATVGDKCMGCVDRAIDCTDKLFAAITDGQGDGRLSGIQWYFD